MHVDLVRRLEQVMYRENRTNLINTGEQLYKTFEYAAISQHLERKKENTNFSSVYACIRTFPLTNYIAFPIVLSESKYLTERKEKKI